MLSARNVSGNIMKTVILKTCETSYEAHLIKHKLESEQIDCFIANENFANLMPNYYEILGNGVQIYVSENDLERASKLIAHNNENIKVACPNCGSSNIIFGFGTKKIAKWVLVAISLLAGIPFNNLNYRFVCKDCRTEFTPGSTRGLLYEERTRSTNIKKQKT